MLILPFLSAKDLKKFGCVHSTVQEFVKSFWILEASAFFARTGCWLIFWIYLGTSREDWSGYIMKILSKQFGLQQWCSIVSFSPTTTKSRVRRKASQLWMIFGMRTVGLWSSTSCQLPFCQGWHLWGVCLRWHHHWRGPRPVATCTYNNLGRLF